MRYFLHLSYQGTQYSGWQRQTTAISIQQIVEESISKILKEEILINGCGRTDSGVHASQYFAHFDYSENIQPSFVKILNLTLPSDISCYELMPVENTAHAQYDARLRTYEYHIHLAKIPHLHHISAYYDLKDLNFELMQKAIDFIIAHSDFRSLCKTPNLYKHTVCRIKKLEMTYNKSHLKFAITADRFLRSMIRLMMARLLEIGEGRLTLEKFTSTLVSKASFEHPHMMKAHPQGLYLAKVEYDYLTRDNSYAL